MNLWGRVHNNDYVSSYLYSLIFACNSGVNDMLYCTIRDILVLR